MARDLCRLPRLCAHRDRNHRVALLRRAAAPTRPCCHQSRFAGRVDEQERRAAIQHRRRARVVHEPARDEPQAVVRSRPVRVQPQGLTVPLSPAPVEKMYVGCALSVSMDVLDRNTCSCNSCLYRVSRVRLDSLWPGNPVNARWISKAQARLRVQNVLAQFEWDAISWIWSLRGVGHGSAGDGHVQRRAGVVGVVDCGV